MFDFYSQCFARDSLDYEYNSRTMAMYTLAKTNAMFKYSGLPDTIKDYELETTLQMNGMAAGIIHNGKPYIIPAAYAGKLNQNYFPTQCVIANPYLNISRDYDIGKDCFPIRNDTYVLGLLPIIQKYCDLIARNEITLKIKDIMSRTPFIITATSDTAKDSALLFMKRLEEGTIGIIHDEKILNVDDVQVLPSSNTSRDITESMEYHQYLKGCFAHDLGLNANYNLKREYVSNGETGLNEDMLRPFVDNMLECRQQDLKAFNEYSGLNITVEFNSAWAEEGEEANEGETVDNVRNANSEADNVTT